MDSAPAHRQPGAVACLAPGGIAKTNLVLDIQKLIHQLFWRAGLPGNLVSFEHLRVRDGGLPCADSQRPSGPDGRTRGGALAPAHGYAVYKRGHLHCPSAPTLCAGAGATATASSSHGLHFVLPGTQVVDVGGIQSKEYGSESRMCLANSSWMLLSAASPRRSSSVPSRFPPLSRYHRHHGCRSCPGKGEAPAMQHTLCIPFTAQRCRRRHRHALRPPFTAPAQAMPTTQRTPLLHAGQAWASQQPEAACMCSYLAYFPCRRRARQSWRRIMTTRTSCSCWSAKGSRPTAAACWRRCRLAGCLRGGGAATCACG